MSVCVTSQKCNVGTASCNGRETQIKAVLQYTHFGIYFQTPVGKWWYPSNSLIKSVNDSSVHDYVHVTVHYQYAHQRLSTLSVRSLYTMSAVLNHLHRLSVWLRLSTLPHPSTTAHTRCKHHCTYHVACRSGLHSRTQRRRVLFVGKRLCKFIRYIHMGYLCVRTRLVSRLSNPAPLGTRENTQLVASSPMHIA